MRKVALGLLVVALAASTANAQMKVQTSTAPQGMTVTTTPVAQPIPPIESARRISRDEAIKLVKAGKAVYVDVRSKKTYDESHIKGALSIPGSEIVGRVREFPPGKLIITYCA
ncbi:MAG TPA: rhodanese-like domain-containing protein [Thermoanaerobaculia bacterium]|nr:rhodanese-like domain-containing protein [Thermoanaerobaculia bacterium]